MKPLTSSTIKYFLRSYVIINANQSKTQHVSCGVPRGRTFGPLVFILYINDIHKSLNNQSSEEINWEYFPFKTNTVSNWVYTLYTSEHKYTSYTSVLR